LLGGEEIGEVVVGCCQGPHDQKRRIERMRMWWFYEIHNWACGS